MEDVRSPEEAGYEVSLPPHFPWKEVDGPGFELLPITLANSTPSGNVFLKDTVLGCSEAWIRRYTVIQGQLRHNMKEDKNLDEIYSSFITIISSLYPHYIPVMITLYSHVIPIVVPST